ncbi:hypothetical protein [Streptacidiphilus sp. EB129]
MSADVDIEAQSGPEPMSVLAELHLTVGLVELHAAINRTREEAGDARQ